MYSFQIDCPNEGLGRVMRALKKEGIRSESRNGPVIRFPKPVCLEYPDPRRRILDHPVRDANHFFHLVETMWMFAGLNTVKELDLFNEQFKQYSDDGNTFKGAYGHRWRHHFGFDQIKKAVEKLKKNPEDRRIVIQIWDAEELKADEGKDFCCNQQVLLDTRFLGSDGEGSTDRYALDMTITNRSNDLIYGAMGSNLFHMSMLHEYIAFHAGLELGTYYQISKNMHLYLENECSKRCWEAMEDFAPASGTDSPPADMSLSEFGLTLRHEPIRYFVQNHQVPRADYAQAFKQEAEPHSEQYLAQVVKPIVEAYKLYKLKYLSGLSTPVEARVDLALEMLNHCKSTALAEACAGWLTDKVEKAKGKRKVL